MAYDYKKISYFRLSVKEFGSGYGNKTFNEETRTSNTAYNLFSMYYIAFKYSGRRKKVYNF